MRVILIASQKGGAGKSTLASHLGVVADMESQAAGTGPALLLDCDPQGSLVFWQSRREKETPYLALASAGDVQGVLEDAERSGIAWAIIDSPPHNTALLGTLMRVADLVLVPIRPGVFDLAASGVTFDTAKALGAHAVAVLNHAPPPSRFGFGSSSNQARKVLERMGVEVLPGQVSQRAALSHALVNGTAVVEYEPNGAASREIFDLWHEIQKLTGAKPVARKAK